MSRKTNLIIVVSYQPWTRQFVCWAYFPFTMFCPSWFMVSKTKLFFENSTHEILRKLQSNYTWVTQVTNGATLPYSVSLLTKKWNMDFPQFFSTVFLILYKHCLMIYLSYQNLKWSFSFWHQLLELNRSYFVIFLVYSIIISIASKAGIVVALSVEGQLRIFRLCTIECVVVNCVCVSH